MSRSGYSDDCEYLDLYRGNVARAIRGGRGQKFLREIADAMDAMPRKELLGGWLVATTGVCAIGAVIQKRGLDIKGVDAGDPKEVGALCGIAPCLAAEIAYINDEDGPREETNAARWKRVRQWVQDCLDGRDVLNG